MGVRVSKSKARVAVESVFDNSTFQSCQVTNVKQTQQVDEIVTEPGCDLNLMLKQEAVMDDECALNALTKNLTDYHIKNKLDIERGLSPNIASVTNDSSEEDIKKKVANFVEQRCQDVDVDQNQKVGKLWCRGGRANIPIIQKFVGKTSCAAEAVMDNVDKWALDNNQTVDDSSGIGDFFKGWLTMQTIMGIIVLIVIALFLYWMTRPDSGSSAAGQAVSLIPLAV